MQPQIQGREIALDGLHPGSMLLARWTSPALGRRLKNDLAGVCILIHFGRCPQSVNEVHKIVKTDA